MDSQELTEWQLLFEIHVEEQELRDEGLTDDEIADVIESRGEHRPERDSTFMDAFLTEEQRAERHRQLLDNELVLDDDDEDDE